MLKFIWLVRNSTGIVTQQTSPAKVFTTKLCSGVMTTMPEVMAGMKVVPMVRTILTIDAPKHLAKESLPCSSFFHSSLGHVARGLLAGERN